MTYWAAGQRLTGARLEQFIQRGIELVSFTSLDSYTKSIVFPVPFDVAPIMAANIAVAPASTARWDVRAIDVTTTQFTLFAFANSSGATVTWSNVAVHWIAVAP